jgi:hypothetical protein
MSREIEDRLRAALSARADRVGEDDLRPPQLPADFDARTRSGRRFRRTLPWLAPVLAAAAAVLLVLGVTNGFPDRRSASNSSAAGTGSTATTSLPAPVTTPKSARSGAPEPDSAAAGRKQSVENASQPAPVITVPKDPNSGELKPLPSAVLGSAAYWPAGDVKGFGEPHPSELNTNGDPAGIVLGITWQDWGLSSATGVGRTYLPKPGGGYFPGTVPIELQATKIGRCGSVVGYQQLYFRTPAKPGGPVTGPWQLWGSADDLCRAR